MDHPLHQPDFESAVFADARDLAMSGVRSPGFTLLENFESREAAIFVGRYLMRRGIRCVLWDEKEYARLALMVPADQIEQARTKLSVGDDPEGFTTLQTFEFEKDARAARDYLQQEGGIRGYLLPPLPSRLAPREFTLLVPNHRVEAAQRILHHYHRQALLSEVTSPTASTPESAGDSLYRATGVALIGILFPPFFFWAFWIVWKVVLKKRTEKSPWERSDKLMLAMLVMKFLFAVVLWYGFLFERDKLPRTQRLFRF